MEETNIVGEITEKNSYFREITWKINHFFSYSTEEGHKIRSPPFHFVGVDCNLSVCPNGTKATPGEIIISLFLRMKDWKHESPPVTCEIGLRSSDGSLIKSNVTEKNLKIGTFMTCNFKKSEIKKNKNPFGPEESLTVFCKLTVGENSRLDEASQTGIQVKNIRGEWIFPETENGAEIFRPREIHVQTDQRCMGIERVLQDFEKLLNSEDDADITITIKDKEFKVHRGIMGTRTPVFAAMFKHDMAEKNTGNVSLDDCEPAIFRDFLHYMYTGIINSLSRDNVFGLYELSDKYQVGDLKEECLDCLKDILSVDTFCDVITLALKHDERELLRLATELFCKKMKDIIVTVKWQVFMCENPSFVNELLVKRMQFESNENL